jgi:hypothetical protein
MRTVLLDSDGAATASADLVQIIDEWAVRIDPLRLNGDD